MNRGVPLRILPPVIDDDRLVERCVSGDRDARRRLFDREKRRVYITLFRILGPGPAVDEALEETFVAAVRVLPTFRGETTLSAFIDRRAVRVALDRLRIRVPPQRLEVVAEEGADCPSTERPVIGREITRRLYGALASLRPRDQVAFALCAIDGRSVAEVADLTGSSPLVVRARVWRVGRRLDLASRPDLDPAEDVQPPTDARWESLDRAVLARLEECSAEALAGPGAEKTRGIRYATAAIAVAAAAAMLVAQGLGGPRSGARVRLATTQGSSTFTVGDASLLVGPQSTVLVGGDDERGIDVVVERGRVDVTSRTGVVVLRGGERWRAGSPMASRAPP